MSDIRANDGRENDVTSIVIQELAGVADRALVTGDYDRCVAIVENIYDLLDGRASAPMAEAK